MNNLIKTASEKWALGAIDFSTLSAICGDEETLQEAMEYGFEYKEKLDFAKFIDIIDLLVGNNMANDEQEAGAIVYLRIKKGQSLERIISNIIAVANL